MKRPLTRCSICGKTLKVTTTDVINKKTGEKSVLYMAPCPKCRRTIYASSMEEMIR